MIIFVSLVALWFLVGLVGSGCVMHFNGRDISVIDLFVLFLCGVFGPVGFLVTAFHFLDGSKVVVIRGRR